MEANKIDPSNDDFVGFYDVEIDKARRNLEWMQQERDKLTETEIEINIRNLYTFTDQLDERRETNFANLFPELFLQYWFGHQGQRIKFPWMRHRTWLHKTFYFPCAQLMDFTSSYLHQFFVDCYLILILDVRVVFSYLYSRCSC